MSSKIIKELAIERIERLKIAFSCSRQVFWDEKGNKLTHPGEYGVFREKAVKDLLELFIPQEFEIETGFLVTNQGDVSTQCDIVIFDKSKTPRLVTESNQRFFPVESTVAVGEVKSNIGTSTKLKESLRKLSKIKALKENIRNPYPYRSYNKKKFEPKKNPFDHIFTFLICNQFDFEPNVASVEYDDDIPARFRHNLIISINDGIFCYKTDKILNFYYPITGTKIHPNRWIPSDGKELPFHFTLFLSSLYNAMNVVTLLEPDMAIYLADRVT